MAETTMTAQTALKFEVEVMAEGRVELKLPFLPGERVTIFVIKEETDVWDDA